MGQRSGTAYNAAVYCGLASVFASYGDTEYFRANYWNSLYPSKGLIQELPQWGISISDPRIQTYLGLTHTSTREVGDQYAYWYQARTEECRDALRAILPAHVSVIFQLGEHVAIAEGWAEKGNSGGVRDSMGQAASCVSILRNQYHFTWLSSAPGGTDHATVMAARNLWSAQIYTH